MTYHEHNKARKNKNKKRPEQGLARKWSLFYHDADNVDLLSKVLLKHILFQEKISKFTDARFILCSFM